MTLNKSSKRVLAVASLMMALGVAIGAFGAHGLKAIVGEDLIKIYNTGVSYHFYNTLGLFALGIIISLKQNHKRLVLSAYLILIGTLIFSISLYLLVILHLPILGAITPIGGTLMIVAWLIATYSILKD